MNRKEYLKKYYLEHKDKYKESSKRFRENHPEYRYKENSERSKEWREKHPDYMTEYQREWRKKHPTYHVEKMRERRAKAKLAN